MANELLRVVSGAAAGTEVVLDGEFVVGRGETGRGNLANDTEISRRHARFHPADEGRFVVEDLGSTNGTYVNGRRISGPTELTSGDEIELGQTLVRFDGGVQETRLHADVSRSTDRTRAGAAVLSPEAAQAPPPAPATPAAPPAAKLPPGGGPASGPPRAAKPGARRGWLDLFALLVAAAVVLAIAIVDDEGASAAANCGSDIGQNGPVQLVSYVQSNITESGDNSVLAIPYGRDMKPQEASQCSTGGSGATQLMMPGVADGNDQIILNQERTLLFAVNQGSDSIAVFRIQPNGGLEPVDGSPFPSNGKAPSSLGISGNTLVVANKARDGVRDLEAETPNYTTFSVASDGKLTPVPGSSIPSEPTFAPTSAVVPDSGGVAFGLEDGGPIRGFSIDESGLLKQAEGSPYVAPDAAFAAGTPPPKKFALGVRAHPTEPFVYMALPTAPGLAVFSYDETGKLTFVKSVQTVGAFLPCWIQITKDGRWLYTSSAGTNNITAFDISNPRDPKQIQDLPFVEPGNAWNIQLDPSDKFLFAISPRAVPAVPEGMGNLQHVMSIGPDGLLTEVGSPTKLPVPDDATPFGLAVVAPGS
ncbi:MAG: FHA domain-containing protein [Actinomycetota bacterium]